MKNIKQFDDFTGEDGYLIVDGLSNEVEGGRKKLSDVKNEIISEIPEPPEQVNADWNAESGKAPILNKPTIPSSGYTRVNLGTITPENSLFTINVNNKEAIKVQLGPYGQGRTKTFRLNLSNDCDDAIIDISDPYKLLRQMYENSVYRGDDKLLIMAPIVHDLTTADDLLKTTRESGSGWGLPEDFEDFGFAFPIAKLGSDYESDVKNRYKELDSEYYTRLIIRIVADYVYVHPIYEEQE